jgi:hypothetical protein
MALSTSVIAEVEVEVLDCYAVMLKAVSSRRYAEECWVTTSTSGFWLCLLLLCFCCVVSIKVADYKIQCDRARPARIYPKT